MKAGLITFHYAFHYGAQLQAYALMKAIEKLGVECEIINYVRPDTDRGNDVFKTGLNPKAFLTNIHTLFNYGAFKRKYDRSESFCKDDMKLSAKKYSYNKELNEQPPQYDVYVCGSDQIWNPLIYAENIYDPAFFMPFAANKKRVAYAPSFGISSIPDDKKEALKNYLSTFSHLSVREKQGEKIIQELSTKPVMTVLDPTLLINGEEWSRIAAAPKNNGEYILCYFVSNASAYLPFIKELSQKYSMPVVTLCGARKGLAGSTFIYDAGPREFLGLFKNASMICTNSFHGTVFSVNFSKPFFSFTADNNSDKSRNSRQHSILSMLGLLDRIVTPSTSMADLHDLYKRGIDYSKTMGLLEAEREKSLNYLKMALYE